MAALLSIPLAAAGACVSGAVPPEPRAAAAPAGDAAVRAAVERSLPFLEREGDRWLRGQVPIQDGQPCVSCHHVGYTLWSHREARRAGVAFDRAPLDDLARRTRTFLADPDKPRVVSVTQMILADEMDDGYLELLRRDGEPAGHWRARGQFPTQRRGAAESDAVASLWALRALEEIDPLDEATAARRERALAWLAAAEPGASTEWTIARLALATRRGEDGTATFLTALLDAQNDDGGWGWFPGEPSNAFTTGQAVYALALGPALGEDARAPEALERAANFLLANQREDGSWETPSRMTSEKASDGKDEIYRYWGTAWASIGLSRALASCRDESPTVCFSEKVEPHGRSS